MGLRRAAWVTGFRLTMDAQGMRRLHEREAAYLARSAMGCIDDVTRRAEQALEKVTLAAIPGKRRPSTLHRGWTSWIFPERGASYSPAGSIRPNGKRGGRTWGALQAYALGDTIKGRNGNWLAIPTDKAGPRNRGRAAMLWTPKKWEQAHGRKLRFVPVPGKRVALLVADDMLLSKRGRLKPNTPGRAKRYGPAASARSDVIFTLVPHVDVARRFNMRATLQPFRAEITKKFKELIAEYRRGDTLKA